MNFEQPACFFSAFFFGAFCLDVRTSTFCQLMGFPLNYLKVIHFSQGSRVSNRGCSPGLFHQLVAPGAGLLLQDYKGRIVATGKEELAAWLERSRGLSLPFHLGVAQH